MFRELLADYSIVVEKMITTVKSICNNCNMGIRRIFHNLTANADGDWEDIKKSIKRTIWMTTQCKQFASFIIWKA